MSKDMVYIVISLVVRISQHRSNFFVVLTLDCRFERNPNLSMQDWYNNLTYKFDLEVYIINNNNVMTI